jgi:hypothetical protein
MTGENALVRVEELRAMTGLIPETPTDAEAQLWLARLRDAIGRP